MELVCTLGVGLAPHTSSAFPRCGRSAIGRESIIVSLFKEKSLHFKWQIPICFRNHSSTGYKLSAGRVNSSESMPESKYIRNSHKCTHTVANLLNFCLISVCYKSHIANQIYSRLYLLFNILMCIDWPSKPSKILCCVCPFSCTLHTCQKCQLRW